MLIGIDCLLKNTEYYEGVAKYMKYKAADMMGNGKNPSFKEMFKEMRRDGLEVDVESLGYAYIGELSGTEGADIAEDVLVEAGMEYEQTVKSYLLDDLTEVNAEGKEKQIGNLSPSQEITRRLIRTFKGEGIVDNSTKSTLRMIQDMYAETLGRMSEPKDKTGKEDKRTWEEKIQDGLERMNIGNRDLDGAILNLETMHKDVKKRTLEMVEELRKAGKDIEADLLEAQVQKFQDLVYSIHLNRKEAKAVIDGALIKKGYAKINKEGEIEVDWARATSQTGSAAELKKNIIEAMVDSGHPQFVAERIADNLNRELVDARDTMVRIGKKRFEPTVSEQAQQNKKPLQPIDDILSEYIKGFENYRKLADRPDAQLKLSPKTAMDLLRHVLEQNGLTIKSKVGSKDRIDSKKLADAVNNPREIRDMVVKYMEDKGYSKEMSEMTADAMQPMYEDLMTKMRDYVTGVMDRIEQTWQPKQDNAAAPTPIVDIIKSRMADANRARKQFPNKNIPLAFTVKEARNILSDILKGIKEFSKEGAKNKLLDWRKISAAKLTEAQLSQIVKEHLKGDFTDAEINEISQALDKTYKEFIKNAQEHATSVLDAKERIEERKSPERQSAIRSLAELQGLGVFEGARQKLLMATIGLDALSVNDMAEIKGIIDAFTISNQEIGKTYGETWEANAEKLINRVVERNQKDKSTLLKVAKGINRSFSWSNFTLVANDMNMIQNITTGAMGNLQQKIQTALQTGTFAFKDRDLFWKTFADVSLGGVATDASVKFGNTQAMSELNNLDFKKNPVKALKTAIVLPLRAALNGADAAFKAVGVNYRFINLLHKSLEKAGWQKQEATEFIYEMMYGENKERAIQKARKIIDAQGKELGVGDSEAAKQRAAVRLANDMIKVNIQMAAELGYDMSGKPPITPEIVEAAFKAAKTGAAISLGHEANNMLSKEIQAGRANSKREYDRLIKQGKYNKAALELFKSTIFYDGIGRLMAGGTNWLWLTADGLGLGLRNVVGKRGKSNYSLAKQELYDPGNPKSMQDAMERTIKYEDEAGRFMMSLIQGAVTFSALAAVGVAARKDDDENVIAAGAKKLESIPLIGDIVKRTAGPLGMMVYINGLSEGDEPVDAMKTAVRVMSEVANLDRVTYSPAAKLQRGKTQYDKGDTGHAWGNFGQAARQVLPGMPILPAYLKMIKDIKTATGDVKKEKHYPYLTPRNFIQGLFYKTWVYDSVRQLPEDEMEWLGFENWRKD